MAEERVRTSTESFSNEETSPMSQMPMPDTQRLVVRERDLSNAATHHLLSKSGSAASLAAAMSVDVKRIKAGLHARHGADALIISPDGSVTVVEVKRGLKNGLLRLGAGLKQHKTGKAA